jgi:hypothetical protein
MASSVSMYLTRLEYFPKCELSSSNFCPSDVMNVLVVLSSFMAYIGFSFAFSLVFLVPFFIKIYGILKLLVLSQIMTAVVIYTSLNSCHNHHNFDSDIKFNLSVGILIELKWICINSEWLLNLHILKSEDIVHYTLRFSHDRLIVRLEIGTIFVNVRI